MKLQYGIFKSLNNPIEVQESDTKTVEIHSMNQTSYLAKFAGKGQFAVWTSDSKSYKLLIEDGYYKTMKDLYGKRVNQVWIAFYEKADKIRFSLMYKMVFPMIGIAMLFCITFLKCRRPTTISKLWVNRDTCDCINHQYGSNLFNEKKD